MKFCCYPNGIRWLLYFLGYQANLPITVIEKIVDRFNAFSNDVQLGIAIGVCFVYLRHVRLASKIHKFGKDDLMRMGCKVLLKMEISVLVFGWRCEMKGGYSF